MSLKLSLDSLTVESFYADDSEALALPKTYEPGCTLPELCGGAVIARPRTYEPGCTLPEICGGDYVVAARPRTYEPGCTLPELCGGG